jgi:hypothetical protein
MLSPYFRSTIDMPTFFRETADRIWISSGENTIVRTIKEGAAQGSFAEKQAIA